MGKIRRLSRQFTLFLLSFVVVVVSGIGLSNAIQQLAKVEITAWAHMIIQTMNAVRDGYDLGTM
ncbi:hypothetical protein Lepto7375DRAFT_7142 [Leptolyngbya sp. PCC 7375]|nr:hypothetical protein Lepto7375DRAFT_7142 [Leptolyngbya sp. PCC 7375]